ncbi:hypothetical protein PHMEG_0007385 [Phytophthora megakarya]|uniref:Uncharacterized protein n=1 Tax=Phytophthora megakarya TaxID=4795 RepID=A0A225WNR6_9STRA|nr:hypothetical protein PHMEG_0007385 [Phytophthora megakarya]
MQLQVVSLALQTHAVGALPHVGVLVSTFLGPSSCLSLSDACSLGSVALLDWLWDVSCVSSSDRTPGWTLNNYLRSEPLYMEWQFREGLQIAASRGDLDTLNWLFHHFSGLEVPSEVVTAAAKNGHLTVLKFLLQHDQGRNCTHENKKVELDEDSWTDSVPVMPTDWKGPGNAVRWGGHATREAVRAKHFDIVRWLDEHALHENDQEEMDDVIYVAANGGSVAFAESILPEGTTVAQYVHERALPDAIQWLLDNNLVLHNQDASASAIFTLAREGNLELMKSVAKLHSTKRLTRDWVQKWEWGMGSACERGDFAMIKWMADHRTGKEACRRDNDNKIQAADPGLGPEMGMGHGICL